jgi:hypothetical protein
MTSPFCRDYRNGAVASVEYMNAPPRRRNPRRNVRATISAPRTPAAIIPQEIRTKMLKFFDSRFGEQVIAGTAVTYQQQFPPSALLRVNKPIYLFTIGSAQRTRLGLGTVS